MGVVRAEPLFSFEVALPKGEGKNKNKIASLNELPKWHWASITKVKNKFKTLLTEWYIPEKPKVSLKSIEIVFKVKRHNKRIIDSDNIGFIIKWTIDAIKEKDWLVDDNEVLYSVEPAVYVKSLIESSVEVIVYERLT